MATHKITWSWKLTRIAGIDVHVHLTFFLILLWIGLNVWRQTSDPAAVVQGIGFVLILFTCVVMHEFGHALTARRFGIKTQRITLLPIGGVAALEKMPDKPKQEILVALAGPCVNMVIASLIWVYLNLSQTPMPVVDDDPGMLLSSGGHLLYNIMYLNIILGVFNLVPAFPMDGGRVLRAVLALTMPHHKATEKAAAVGQVFAVILFGLGLLYNPFLILISAFIWIAAAGEAGAEKLQYSLHGVTAGDVMLKQFQILHDHDTLSRAVDLSIHSGQRHFPVKATGETLKVLDHQKLLAAVREHGENLPLSALALPELPCIEPHTDAESLLKTLHSGQAVLFGIQKNQTLCGLVSMDEMLEWLSFHQGEEVKKKRSF